MADDPDWDEHASWTALLDDDDDTALADRTAPVDRLGPAFATHRRQGKEYIKHTLIPVVQRTQQLHAAIQNDVFPRHAQGLALFDNVTLRFETAARHDMAAAQSVYDDAKHSLDVLCSTLDSLASQRDLLFQAFKTSMLKHVQCLRLYADEAPADAERLISTLDRKARHLGAEDHAKAKENLLRGILGEY